MVYSDNFEDKIDIITKRLKTKYRDIINPRWHSIKILEKDSEILKKYPIQIDDIVSRSYESDIINQKYDFIDEIIKECVINKAAKSEKSDKIDKVLTNKYLGMPIFFAIMALVFLLTFYVGDIMKEIFAGWLDIFSNSTNNFLHSIGMNRMIISLIVDGIIAGVGGILTFLPNIIILFFALAFLEDSGYMARVAYVMDGIMEKIGLSGKAFIPMILGFGCSVPAVMASRTLENYRDKLKTILLIPFMSCSAKIPIYVLFAGMFFPNYSAIVAFSMYIFGLILAIIVALIINKFDKDKSSDMLLIELPEYKTPNPRTVFIYVWEKIKDYLNKAGTTIFIASIILWFLLNFGFTGLVENASESFGARIGELLAPILKPAGLGYWQIVVALISGLAAKEVVVSSMSVLYGIEEISSSVGMETLLVSLMASGFGAINAISLMVFSLLYVPCIAAIATIKKEAKSTKFTLLVILFQMALAWFVSTLIYQLGKIITYFIF